MAPAWLSKWIQDDQQIDAKNDHVFDASWNRFLDGCLWILDGKMEPSWYQNGIKNRFIKKHEKTHLERARLCQIGLRGTKLGANIDQKSIQQ